MAKYETKFIQQNKAPNDYIYVYNGTELVGKIKSSGLKMPMLGSKLYSFGALSDVHVSSASDFKFTKAFRYLNDVEKVKFTCIAGDLTWTGLESEFENYASCVAPWKDKTWECTGNHDVQTSKATFDFLKSYTGHDLYYSFTEGNDVFIMFGMTGWASYTGEMFSAESLQWLYETLEANRNKRCFVFEHCPRFSSALRPYPTAPTGDLLNGDTGRVFQSLMAHYENVVWFHGHTHIVFDWQKDCQYANYDNELGCHSIHIPALVNGKTYDDAQSKYVTNSGDSFGYVVDVYESNIVLRGRDFAHEKFVPIATYCLNTTLKTIEANTFTDSTGTIKT
jgi:hypothetical protein